MKTLSLLIALCCFGNALAETLATGTATRILQTETYWLRFKVSKDAKPGLLFYPRIRFVLDDGTWIGGSIGCFPSGASAGPELGGTINTDLSAPIPAGKTLKYVDIVAVVGGPKDSLFALKIGEEIPRLDEKVMNELKKKGGFVIRFPFKSAEQDETL